ncbi:hypothetical protein Tco_0139924, partial [Tanacetum coccineum]
MRSHNQLVLLDTTHHHPAAAADTAVDTMVAEGTADNTGHTVAEHNQHERNPRPTTIGASWSIGIPKTRNLAIKVVTPPDKEH